MENFDEFVLASRAGKVCLLGFGVGAATREEIVELEPVGESPSAIAIFKNSDS